MNVCKKWDFSIESSINEEIDVAIRVGQLQDSSLIAKKLGVTKLGLYARSDYFKDRTIPIHPSQLDAKECIGLNVGNNSWLFQDGKKELNITPQHRYKVNNMKLVQTAVLKGLGIAMLPQKICEPYLGKILILLLENYAPKFGNVYTVYLSKKYMSSKLRVFLDYLQNHV